MSDNEWCPEKRAAQDRGEEVLRQMVERQKHLDLKAQTRKHMTHIRKKVMKKN